MEEVEEKCSGEQEEGRGTRKEEEKVEGTTPEAVKEREKGVDKEEEVF